VADDFFTAGSDLSSDAGRAASGEGTKEKAAAGAASERVRRLRRSMRLGVATEEG
jgi:hypothetical protein